MNITAAFTNFNRTDLLYNAIQPFIDNDRISEIVISDDCSHMEFYNTVYWQFASVDKVKIFRNETNVDCYLNKKLAIERATNEWVLILDSDNLFSKEYIDRLENLWVAGLNDRTVYQPEFAKPHFDFRHIAGVNLTRGNIANYIHDGRTQTMLNAMNYFVNREQYLKVFDPNIDPVTSDSLYQNHNWLAAGNSIYVVPGLQYEHRVHSGSHYQQNVRRTAHGFHESIIDNLKRMKAYSGGFESQLKG